MPTPAYARGRLCVGMTIPLPPAGHRKGRLILDLSFIATYRMERACAMQLAFQQSGAEFYPIGDKVVSAAYIRPTGGRNEPAKFEWPALLRKLDRIDPFYKQ